MDWNGFVYWNVTHSRAERVYAISRQYGNQGDMTESVKKMIDYGFAHMNLVRIEARCLVDNAGSARGMEKAGMTVPVSLRK